MSLYKRTRRRPARTAQFAPVAESSGPTVLRRISIERLESRLLLSDAPATSIRHAPKVLTPQSRAQRFIVRGSINADTTGTANALTAPYNVSTVSNLTSVGVYWSESSTVTSFKIQRSTHADFSTIDYTTTLSSSSTRSYIDHSVQSATQYYYRIWAFNASGQSDPVSASAIVPDLPPTSLSASLASPSEIDLQWTNRATTAQSINVLRHGNGGSFVVIGTLPANATSYRDVSLTMNTAYGYEVQQVGPFGSSTSNPVSAHTPAPDLTALVAQLPAVVDPRPSSNPSAVVTSGGIGYFVAEDDTQASDVWRTDGTAAGTTMLEPLGYSAITAPHQLTDVNGTVFFVGGSSDTAGTGLWKTDGTSGGTTFMNDTNAAENNPITDMVNFNGELYFRAPGGGSWDALWKSDGTPAGTVPVLPFFYNELAPMFSEMVVAGGKLFLAAYNPSGSLVLYVSDGTAAGTVQLANTGETTDLSPVGNGIFFVAPLSGQLWYSDGTAAGTHPIANSPNMGTGTAITAMDGRAYFFVGGSQLWTSDGTAPGTFMISSSQAGVYSDTASVAFNGSMAYAVTDGKTQTQLWVTDGNAASAAPVMTFTSDTGSADISQMAVFNGDLYFFAEDPVRKWVLYKSDGTTAGTTPVASFAGSSRPDNFSVYGSLLTFSADDGVHGIEPWKTDGTPAGTTLLKDINGTTYATQPDGMTRVNNTVFFTQSLTQVVGFIGGVLGNSGTPVALWKTDGTAAGTQELAPIPATNLLAVGDTLYFAGTTGADGTELWKSDGTSQGTVMVKDLAPGPASSDPLPIADLNGTLIFGIPDSTPGDYQLWRSDGTDAGTSRISATLIHLNGATAGTSKNFALMGGEFYFDGTTGDGTYHLWRTDGTSSGTSQVSSVQPLAANFLPVNQELYLSAQDPSGVEALYMSDGTATGTTPVLEISSINSLIDLNGVILFAASDPVHGNELWKSDGTASGTQLVQDINPGAADSSPQYLTAVGNLVYFIATLSGGSTPYALYKTDGTSSGTSFVDGVTLESSNSQPYLVNVSGTLAFSDGSNLWTTNGTQAGTRQLSQLYDFFNAGRNAFNGSPYATLGNQLLFSGFISGDGRDLRSVSTTLPPAPTALIASVQPSDLSQGANATGTPAVTLGWSYSANSASGFVVDRATNSGFSVNLASFFVPAGVTSFTDTSMAPGALYYYRVRAINAAGASPESNTVQAIVKTAVQSIAVELPSGSVPLQTSADGLRLVPQGRNTDVAWTGFYKFQLSLANATLLSTSDIRITGANGVSYGRITLSGAGAAYVISLARPVNSADRLTITISNPFIATFTREIDVLPGDTNDDGQVNFADFVVLSGNFGKSVSPGTAAPGDFNGDGIVNFADFVALSQDFGNSLPAIQTPAIRRLGVFSSTPVKAPAPVRRPAPMTVRGAFHA